MNSAMFRSNKQGMLFRRWEPGQGYYGPPGITGIGEETVYPSDTVFSTDVYADSGDYGGPSGSDWEIDTSGIKPGSGGIFDLPGGEPGWNTPYDLAQLAKTITSYGKLGIKAVAPNRATGACPAGTVLKGAVCVQLSAPRKPTAQWFSFATNQQVVMWGGVAFASVLLVSMLRRK